MVIADDIFAMLLVEKFFKTFTSKRIADAGSTEVMVALTTDSREDVDRMVDIALAAGAKPSREPDDQTSMYVRSFEDLDGHIWEYFWMDPAQSQG